MKRELSRRDFLKSSGALAAGVLASQALPFAAAQDGLPFEVAPEAMNPLGLEAGANVEGVFFEGGFGRSYIDNAADIFRALHPENEMSVEGIQQVSEILRPRFIGGNPPDVIDNSGAFNIPMDSLVADDQLADLGPLMAAPALDTPEKTFAETLFPGSQENGVFDGRQLYLNIAYTVSGIWHSQSLFEEKGYDYPRTWDGLMGLCETIKSDGIAPWTYQGKFPGYMVFGCLHHLIHKTGGIQTIYDLDNLVDGVWQSDAVLQALNMMYQLVENDYILPGTEGLTHTESQAEWLQGNAAFIPCGTWLENEMRELTPDGFNMVIKPLPGPDESTYDSLGAWPGEPYIVPKNAANVVGGMEFMRCMLSKANAGFFAKEISAIMPVFGGSESVELSGALTSALQAVEAANGGFNVLYGGWYSDLRTQVNNSTGELMTGRITPEQFAETVQASADAVKADSDIPKYTRA
ncbi:MAG: N-acetylglucosamine/diacetylchitobiose ABC transporter substrate-binding protein [Chloroflexi bacterium]|nr:N-acetylglucosamine/diacetylchitobiose ABC transporter substrate-binding protein [Chloroflexota bacterium]MCY4247459.1 N-acetylglucosamine/diacetylchitobiose ABC transporter substrate-binding protein [Chloroflexota bacterium]